MIQREQNHAVTSDRESGVDWQVAAQAACNGQAILSRLWRFLNRRQRFGVLLGTNGHIDRDASSAVCSAPSYSQLRCAQRGQISGAERPQKGQETMRNSPERRRRGFKSRSWCMRRRPADAVQAAALPGNCPDADGDDLPAEDLLRRSRSPVSYTHLTLPTR